MRYYVGENNGGWLDEKLYEYILKKKEEEYAKSQGQQNQNNENQQTQQDDLTILLNDLEGDKKALEQQSQTMKATKQIIDSRIGAKQNNGQNGNSVQQQQQTTVMSVGDNGKLTEAEIAARKKQNSK